MKTQRAKVFWSGRSQAVRLPKEFRFEGDAVLVHKVGSSVVLEPVDAWPDGYAASFSGAPVDFDRPGQGATEAREKL